jgi:hypothetical protein
MFGDRTKAWLCAACAKKSMERAVSAAKFTAALHQVTEGECYNANKRKNADPLVFWRNECGWMRCEDTLLGATLLRMPLNLQKEVQSQRARLLDGSEAVQIVTARMLILPMSHWLIDDVENTTAQWLCAGDKVV